MKTLLALSFAALLSVVLHSTALAQWQLNGTAISTATNTQYVTRIVPDGAGGAIIVWMDVRSGTTYDLYAQRVNAAGVPQWTADGILISAAANNQFDPAIIADGAGGAIIAWTDYRSLTTYDVYAQRLNASGVPQWTANGVAVSTGAGNQESSTIVSDGSGGAIMAWADARGGNYDIYTQRLNASGAAQWTANGVSLCVAANNQTYPTIVSDGAGGAIVTWQDFRNGSNNDIYARRVNGAGVPQWTADGVALCTAANYQYSPMIASDGGGGAIVAWYDYRSGTNYDIYARRVNAAGTPQWTADGNLISAAASDQFVPVIVSDGGGGAIVAWYDYRSGIDYDIYAQRVNASGAMLWTQDGAAVSTATSTQQYQTIVSDGAGGAIITWEDYRSGSNNDLYAQRMTAQGIPQWDFNGAPVSTGPGTQAHPAIASDGAGGAIIAWEDYRGGSSDVYALRVEGDFGDWGQPEPLLTSVSDVPRDQGGKVAVNWKRSGHDVLPFQEITHYSVWRAVSIVSASSAAASAETFTDPSKIGPDFHGVAISRERIGATEYYWEWVANQNSTHDAGYSFAASTRADSVAGNIATHYFRVVAHTFNQFVLYKSNAVSGHSVDNLAPPAPLFLTALRAGANVNLKWNRVRVPDLRDYSVYRATASGVTPVPPNFLADSDDTVLVDTGAPPTALYYIVTAHDVHANQGPKSNEAAVSSLTGAGNLPPITALTLQNHPNPFAGTTELQIGLPRAADVSLEVYDVAGRRVHAQSLPLQAAGWRRVTFDGRDNAGHMLASGVYFARVSAGGATVTRKIVIAR